MRRHLPGFAEGDDAIMGVYYRLVNLETKEAIEPGEIGGGGVKHYAIVNGDTARLFTWLHMLGETEWFIAGDDDYEGLTDATDTYLDRFNEWYEGAKIERCHDD
jgi:hypothetical protein